MKKRFLFLSGLILVFATGCGEKTLNCTITNNANEDLVMKNKVSVVFKNDKVKKIDMTASVELDDKYADYIDEFEKNLKTEFKKYNNKKGVEVKTTKKDKNVTLKLVANLDKMDKSAKEDLDMVNTDGTMKDVKASLVKEGYSCKEA